jgi:phosphopantothenoylcysteine decarboxylase/phosphopantothenate--cysteine ligase
MKGRELFGNVVYISGPGQPQFLSVEGALNIHVDTTEEMSSAVHDHIAPHSILFMTAAPADYRPAKTRGHKIKKESTSSLEIKFVPTIDILMSISSLYLENFYKVGFAAETDNILENAISKMMRKNLDFICANKVNRDQIGFGNHSNTLMVIDREKNITQLGPCEKEILAEELLVFITKNVAAKGTSM